MKRIKLTKEEKETLRIVDKFNGKCPCGFPLHVYNLSVRSLERKGLIKAAYLEGGAVEDARPPMKENTTFVRIPIYETLSTGLLSE